MAGCDHTAEVKQEKGKRRRLYLVCQAHGIINLSGAAFQEFILENATIQGRGQPPEVAPEVFSNPAPVPVAPPGQNADKMSPIEQGPAPLAYPAEAGAPQPIKAPPPAQPSPVPRPKPKPKTPPQPGPRRGGLFSWLNDGLSEL